MHTDRFPSLVQETDVSPRLRGVECISVLYEVLSIAAAPAECRPTYRWYEARPRRRTDMGRRYSVVGQRQVDLRQRGCAPPTRLSGAHTLDTLDHCFA